MRKIKFASETKILFILLAIGFFFRIVNLEKRAVFEWDQERTATLIFEAYKKRKPLLIGPKVGPANFFLGPLYYYFTAPFLILTKFNPLGLYYSAFVFSAVSAFLLYFFAKEIFGKKTALLALAFYLFSPLLIYFDRLPWNVNLLLPASLLFIYALFKISRKEKRETKDFLLLGVALGLGFQAHFSFCLFFPIMFIWLLLKKKFGKKLFSTFLIFFFFISSWFLFELRHQFLNSKNIFIFLNNNYLKLGILPLHLRFINNFYNLLKLPANFFFNFKDSYFYLFFGLILLVYLAEKLKTQNKDKNSVYQLFFLFILVYFLFFPLYKDEIPEYYYFALIPVWLCLSADFAIDKLSHFFKKEKVYLFIFFLLFFLQNCCELFHYKGNSLFYKRKVVDEIIKRTNNQPFRITFITDPGNEFGFDYFFLLKGNSLYKNDKNKDSREFFILYPYEREMRKKDYQKIGDFGLKIKEPFYDKNYFEYFNNQYLFGFDLYRHFTLLDCSLGENGIIFYQLADKEEGSCNQPFKNKQIRLSFYIGEKGKLSEKFTFLKEENWQNIDGKRSFFKKNDTARYYLYTLAKNKAALAEMIFERENNDSFLISELEKITKNFRIY